MRRSVIETNLTSAFLGAKACSGALIESRGNIVHTASASGLGGDAGLTAYNAAKGGLVNFTRGLAFDLGRSEVQVNAVAPSFTLVEGAEDVLTEDFMGAFRARRGLQDHRPGRESDPRGSGQSGGRTREKGIRRAGEVIARSATTPSGSQRLSRMGLAPFAATELALWHHIGEATCPRCSPRSD